MNEVIDGGRAPPKEFIRRMMGKQKPVRYSRTNIQPPFRYSKMDNPSVFIQTKYSDRPPKPFDYVKAQERREEAERETEDNIAQIAVNENLSLPQAVRRYQEYQEMRKEVKKPEWWGLEWSDFTEKDGRMMTADGLAWPPLQWRDKTDGKLYWGLPYYPKREKNAHYSMLFFKEGYEPTNLPEFSDNTKYKAIRESKEHWRKPNQVSLDKELTLRHRGTKLKGTNKTKATDYAVTKAIKKRAGKVKNGEVLPARERRKVRATEAQRDEIRHLLD